MQNGRHLILNVDDNEAARYARRRVLTAAGFHVEDAATGAEALRLAAQLAPPLVLLDVRLPDIDGFEVCRRLKRAASGKTPVVVHISAEAAGERSQAAGLDNGAEAYLTEPVDSDVLVAIVRSLLRGHETQRALAEERDKAAGTNARLAAVLESTTDCVIYIEPDWNISYLNTRARDTISQGRDLIGLNLWDAFPAAVETEFFTAYTEAMRDRKPAHFEAWYEPLGTWFEIHAHPAEGGGLAIFFRDINEKKRIHAERRRALEELERRENEYKTLAENAPEVIARLDRGLRHTYINRYGASVYGFPREQVIGKTNAELGMPPEKVAFWKARFEEVLATGSQQTVDFEFDSPTFGHQYFSALFVPEFDANGEAVSILAITRDVTELRRADDELRRVNTVMEAINSGAVLLVAVKDTASRYVKANRATLQMIGRPAAEVYGKCDLELLGPQTGAEIMAVDRRVMNTGRTETVEIHITRPHGEYWLLSTKTPLRDHEGRITGVVLVANDITERKRAEAALVESERNFRELADSMPQLVWVALAGGRYVYFNRRWYQQAGLDAATPLSEHWSDLLHPEDRERCLSHWRHCVETGEPYQIEYRFRVAGGEYRWFLARAVPVRDSGGSIARWFGTATDIEDSKRAEAALRQTQKFESVGLLAGGIAHDFNNLLVGVIGNASLAADLLPSRHPAAEILDRVVESGEQAAHLTRQLLAYAGKGRFIIEPVNLSSLVEDARALIESSVSKRIAFHFDLDPKIPAVETDASQMQQVLMNLALNAAEAIGGKPGTISVGTGEVAVDEEYIASRLWGDWTIAPGRHVFLGVADTGCGMDKATMEKIFDPFFTTKFQGRGLGLAAVAGIVRSNNGAIEVTAAPGAGAVFRVLLPAMKTAVNAASRRPQSAEDLPGPGG